MNNSELFNFAPYMVEDERSVLHTVPQYERTSFVVIHAVCGVWGTLMKLFLFFHLKKEKISERPINVLIIIDQTVDFIGNLVITINTVVKVSLVLNIKST